MARRIDSLWHAPKPFGGVYAIVIDVTVGFRRGVVACTCVPWCVCAVTDQMSSRMCGRSSIAEGGRKHLCW